MLVDGRRVRRHSVRMMDPQSEVPIGLVGRVLSGDHEGFYIEVDDDTMRAGGTGGYYVLVWNLDSGTGYDDCRRRRRRGRRVVHRTYTRAVVPAGCRGQLGSSARPCWPDRSDRGELRSVGRLPLVLRRASSPLRAITRTHLPIRAGATGVFVERSVHLNGSRVPQRDPQRIRQRGRRSTSARC